MKRLTLALCLTLATATAAAAQIDVQLGDGLKDSDTQVSQVSIAYTLLYTTDIHPTPVMNSSVMNKFPMAQFNNWFTGFNTDISTYQLQKGSMLTLGYYNAAGDKIIPQNCENIALNDTNHIVFSITGCIIR